MADYAIGGFIQFDPDGLGGWTAGTPTDVVFPASNGLVSDSDGASPNFEIGETITATVQAFGTPQLVGTGTFVGTQSVDIGGGSLDLPVFFDGTSYFMVYPEGTLAAQYDFPTSTGGSNPFTPTFDDGAAFPVCFLSGTRIATPDGETRVEDLSIGDLILTASGAPVPVKWIGYQTVSTRFGPAERLMPVRVASGALGDGLPLRDLTLTADHALLIDGLLVNAGALLNGSSIMQVPLSELGDGYTVYHIETEDHAIILAEGTPAETYIDYVARSAFDNHAEYQALYGEDRTIPEMPVPRISAARHLPETIRTRLAGTVAA